VKGEQKETTNELAKIMAEEVDNNSYGGGTEVSPR